MNSKNKESGTAIPLSQEPRKNQHNDLSATVVYHNSEEQSTIAAIPAVEVDSCDVTDQVLDELVAAAEINTTDETASKPNPLGAWKIRTLEDAYKPRPPIKYIVDGLIEAPSLNIVYGAPGSLKSMILGDLSVCVASELPWLPPLPSKSGVSFRTTRVPVLWVDIDNGKRRTDERFEAFGKGRDLPTDIPLYYVSMPDPPLFANDRANINGLADLIIGKQVKLVVIDNLGLIVGGAKENESGMAEVMGNLRYLAEETGAAIILIHHERKSNSTGARMGESL